VNYYNHKRDRVRIDRNSQARENLGRLGFRRCKNLWKNFIILCTAWRHLHGR